MGSDARLPLPTPGHVQSHLRWGFGGGATAPEDLFCCFLAASPPKNNKNWSLGRSPKDFAHALLPTLQIRQLLRDLAVVHLKDV